MRHMEFTEMRDKLITHFTEMTKDTTHLFEVNVGKDEMWNTYLDSYPPGTNEIYRERREYDCSCCRHFVKAIGNAVVIKNNKVETIWDFETGDEVFQPVLNAMAAFIKSHTVTDIYISHFKKIGALENFESLPDGKIQKWEHFYLNLPDKFVNRTSRSEGEIKGQYRDVRNVFKRSLDEITMDSVDTVLELIASNTLYKGEEWKKALTDFKKYKKEYEATPQEEKDNYAWEKSIIAGPVIGKIRNHSIGVLLINLSEGMDLEEAVKKYEAITASSNYKRSKPIFTKKMLEDAQKTIAELGYMESLKRRFATLDDITVNNILFSNKDAAKRITDANDLFSEMAKDVVVTPKKFSKVEEIGIEKFVKDVLPTAKEVEVFLENKHIPNMVSLIAPEDMSAKSMFKWNNPFSWAYSGNITDSDIRQNVKSAGGSVDGVLRFSIQWNEDGNDRCDLDAHAIEPDKTEIAFSTYKKSRITSTSGQLDVDIVSPGMNAAVENITWADLSKMKTGIYKFFVHQYSGSVKKGFRAEIEFNGEIHSFDYNKSMRAGEKVTVAEVTLDSNGNFTIKEKLAGESRVQSKEVWGLNTNQFVPVSVVMYSPNYWDEQSGIGHKHYFFMLKDCVNNEEPNGYYNEFLKEDLMKHKRVFEALGAKAHVKDVDDQLSGIGFSSTKRAELVVKVKGATERVMKIKF